MKTLVLRIPDALARELDAEAKKTHLTKSEVVRRRLIAAGSQSHPAASGFDLIAELRHDAILAPRADGAHLHDSGMLQDAQMFGNVVLRKLERAGEIVYAKVAGEQRLDQAQSGPVCHRLQDFAAVGTPHAAIVRAFNLLLDKKTQD